MPFYIVRNNITRMNTDVVVNAANCSLKMGSGVCGDIFTAAGSAKLQAECDKIGYCSTGKAVITKAYNLPAKYIIHTPGPVWHSGTDEEISLLYNCYISSMELAIENKCQSIAFPLISSGIYGFPKEIAFQTAFSAITEFLKTYDLEVYLVIFNQLALVLNKARQENIRKYIENNYMEVLSNTLAPEPEVYDRCDAAIMPAAHYEQFTPHKKAKQSLKDAVTHLDESFSEMLIRLIDEKNLTDVETYKRANIDRKLFSKIRSSAAYNPSKNTAIAFAVALQLNIDDTLDLLKKSGYTLSDSSKFDVIIKYHIENNLYNIYEINEALFAFDQPILGR